MKNTLDNRNETMGKKIRDAEMQKVPYMIIVGEQEELDGTISVRKHGGDDLGTISVESFTSIINEEIKKTLKEF
jgi:threonyl-tRNA synthetase